MKVRIQKKQARFRRIREAKGPDSGVGEFFLLVDVLAEQEDVYVPLSIASGKKPTGFVYQIEGTGEATIVTTDMSVKGTGVSQVTLGTLVYVKIPKGKTATFRMLITMRGKVGKEYGITINAINYKLSPTDARYKKLAVALESAKVKFG